jgi:hypothetical protein
MDNKIIKKSGCQFSEIEKHQMIRELLSTHCTKQWLWEKYTGELQEHGQLLRWMRELGYQTIIKTARRNIVSNINNMAKQKDQLKPEESFENLQLKKRISELEKQLKDAELKAIAFSTMVDIAEKEFKISIRKKFNTKP